MKFGSDEEKVSAKWCENPGKGLRKESRGDGGGCSFIFI